MKISSSPSKITSTSLSKTFLFLLVHVCCLSLISYYHLVFKVSERVVAKQLTVILKEHNIFNTFESGFCQLLSTETAIRPQCCLQCYGPPHLLKSFKQDLFNYSLQLCRISRLFSESECSWRFCPGPNIIGIKLASSLAVNTKV